MIRNLKLYYTISDCLDNGRYEHNIPKLMGIGFEIHSLNYSLDIGRHGRVTLHAAGGGYGSSSEAQKAPRF